MATGHRRRQCELALHRRGNRERHRVDVSQQCRVVVVGRDAVGVGEGLGTVE